MWEARFGPRLFLFFLFLRVFVSAYRKIWLILQEYKFTAMKRLFSLLLACVACVTAYSVPACPAAMAYTQPDGSVLHVRLVGDEYGSYFTTEDGYMVAENALGVWEYVRACAADGCELSGLTARDALERTAVDCQLLAALPKASDLYKSGGLLAQSNLLRAKRAGLTRVWAGFPLKNSPRSLVILVNFADKSFVVDNPQQAFARMLNESGYSINGATGSARDYFMASSDSVFSPYFDVYGPYTLPENMAYYGGNSSSRGDVNAAAMIKQAVSLACDAGVDLAQYDTDGDGVLDNVFVYYAGHNEAEHGGANTVWPHRSVVLNSPEYCGVRIYDYACTSELRGSNGNVMCGIGTFCHEFGHVLGLPDMYDTGNSDAYTIGEWDIMCSGSYNNNGRTPPSYSSYERFMLGWITPVQIDKAGNYALTPLTADNNAYLLAAKTHNMSGLSPNPTEFFLLENRQRVGWDAGTGALVGTGMLVWHINYNAARWRANAPNNNGNLGIDIVEAYSKNPTTSLASDTYPGTRNITNLSPTLSDGTALGYPLTGIGEMPDGTIVFALNGGDGSGFSFQPTALPEFVSTFETVDYNSHVEYAVNELRLLGNKLSPLDTAKVLMRNNFQISLDSIEWTTTMRLPVAADSSLDQRVWVRYAPTRQNCNAVSGSLTIQNTEYVNSMVLSGRAPNPQHIAVPTIDSITELTPYSFFLNWRGQADATTYYVTLYRIDDVRSEVRRPFDNFTSFENIRAAGWNANFVSTSTAFKSESARSVYFNGDGNMLLSEKYPMAATALSFWTTANYTGAGDTVGGALMVDAFDGERWHPIDSIDMKRTSKNITKSYSFDLGKNFVQFRFTYRHKAGSGGVALDNFAATFDKQITYIYRGTEKELYVGTERNNALVSFYINDLTPSTTYYCQVQCTDAGNAGCEVHLTDLSEPQKVTTLAGESADSRRFTVAYENGEYIAYLPEARTNRRIFVYDMHGFLVAVVPIESSAENRVALPRLVPNTVYLLKYSEEGRHKRKDKWAKLLYQTNL